MSAHFLAPVVRHPERSWTLRNDTTGQVVAATLIPAFDRQTRNQGLLQRDGLPASNALVLAPCSGVHTWFMRFPIDIAFVSREGRVLSVRRNVGPWRIALRLGAFAVVEMPANSTTELLPGHTLSASSGPNPQS